MQLRINGDELNKLLKAVSKDKAREVLHCLHIERHGNFLEFVTTDGSILVRHKRDIEKYKDDVPEDFKITLDLSNYKINNKYIYDLITDESGKFVLIGSGFEVLPKISCATYPNYNIIIDGYEKLPKAIGYAVFNPKYTKILFDILGEDFYKIPQAKDRISPHFWTCANYLDTWTCVLMPMVGK